MSRRNELSGQRFGRLLVLARDSVNAHGNYCWHCRCDCGQETIVAGGTLRSGKTRSCGCLRRETSGARNLRHGHAGAKTSEYKTWTNMLARCANPNSENYAHYGGRGITVCTRWLQFEHFFADMGERPAGLTLDRIDNEKGYASANCRWVTPQEQARNRRSNHLLTHAGKTQCTAAWAEQCGLKIHTIYMRLSAGWDVVRALTTPARKHTKREAT